MTNIVFKKIILLFLFLCVNSLLAIEEDQVETTLTL